MQEAAKHILEILSKNPSKEYSVQDLSSALKEKGIKINDVQVMIIIRTIRDEEDGLIDLVVKPLEEGKRDTSDWYKAGRKLKGK